MRSVSIVGIGATPFMNLIKNDTYHGLTNGELFGHAALDAMKDAHIDPALHRGAEAGDPQVPGRLPPRAFVRVRGELRPHALQEGA